MFEISIVLNEIKENATGVGGTKTEKTFAKSGMSERESLEFILECAKQLFLSPKDEKEIAKYRAAIQDQVFPEGDRCGITLWNAILPDPRTGKLRHVRFISEMRMEMLPEDVDPVTRRSIKGTGVSEPTP